MIEKDILEKENNSLILLSFHYQFFNMVLKTHSMNFNMILFAFLLVWNRKINHFFCIAHGRRLAVKVSQGRAI